MRHHGPLDSDEARTRGGATIPVSRRGFLGAVGGTLAAATLSTKAEAQAATAKRLTAGTRILEVNGRPAQVFGLTGPNGRPGLHLAPGERFRIDLANETGEPTLIHWHGQLPPWMQDGFPWPQTPAIPNGAVASYDYAPISGTYWMHSHHAMQEQSLLTAPLVVDDAASLHEDRQDIVLMLNDFSFRSPEELLASVTGTSVADAHGLAQGSESAGPAAGQAKPAMTMPAPAMQGMGITDMGARTWARGGSERRSIRRLPRKRPHPRRPGDRACGSWRQGSVARHQRRLIEPVLDRSRRARRPCCGDRRPCRAAGPRQAFSDLDGAATRYPD